MAERQNETLGDALAQAQAEFPPIERNKTVTVKTKTGGSYKFAYAPLDSIFNAVRPALSAHGLAVTQLLTSLDGHRALETRLIHKSGEEIAGVFPLPVENGIGPQELGSLLTYIRRYALVAILGIATEEDDDGNHAAGNTARSTAYQEEERRNPQVPVPRSYAELEDLWSKQNLDTGWFEEAVRVYEAQHGSKAGSFQMLASVYVELVETGPSGSVDWFEADQVRAVFASRLEGVVLEGPQPAVAGEDPDIDLEGPSQ